MGLYEFHEVEFMIWFPQRTFFSSASMTLINFTSQSLLAQVDAGLSENLGEGFICVFQKQNTMVLTPLPPASCL